jgi:hypothetical protein
MRTYDISLLPIEPPSLSSAVSMQEWLTSITWSTRVGDQRACACLVPRAHRPTQPNPCNFGSYLPSGLPDSSTERPKDESPSRAGPTPTPSPPAGQIHRPARLLPRLAHTWMTWPRQHLPRCLATPWSLGARMPCIIQRSARTEQRTMNHTVGVVFLVFMRLIAPYCLSQPRGLPWRLSFTLSCKTRPRIWCCTHLTPILWAASGSSRQSFNQMFLWINTRAWLVARGFTQ